jgi:hemin uptake protein HemP
MNGTWLFVTFFLKTIYLLFANDYHYLKFNREKKLVKTLIQSINQPESNKKTNAVMPLRLKSQEIFKQQNNVVIEHEGEEYHLKLTKQNKLILTK